MATWIDASTDAYWYSFDSAISYLGDGDWECVGNGGWAIIEKYDSPLKSQYDEYTYIYTGENVTVSGIRIYYSFAKIEYWDFPNNFTFSTNYARESTLIPNGLLEGNQIQEWVFEPDIDERITQILFPFGFGSNYASTAIVTKIELRTSITPDNLWRDYRNTKESISV